MILILDDHPLVRQGLESIIKMSYPDQVIIQAGTIREAIGEIEKNEIDKVFVDLNLGSESGFSLIEWVRKKELEIKIFLITSSSSTEDFIYAKELMVDAYILKDAFIDDIVYGIKVVERGGRFYSAGMLEQMESVSEEDRRLQELTGREKEVLQLLAKGYSNYRISQELYISEGTTKKHISNILSKLGVENRVEATIFISNHKLVAHTNMKGGRVV